MFEAYKIGITLSLTNHVSRGLMMMAGDFAKTEAQATLLQKRIKSIQEDAIKGGLMLAGGVGMLSLLKGPYEEAKKLAQAQVNFQTLNLTSLENSEAFGKAASMSHKILGTTITENVKLIHDLHTAFGDLHHALGTADMFAKMSIVAKVANGGQEVDGLVNAAAKALEHRGGKVINSPAAFETEADLMTKVMLATKMRVSPKDYLTASGTGKMAYQLYDKEYLYGNFAGQMAINGGARTGTEGMTAFSSLIGGHMDAKGKGFLADLGLWQEGFSKKRLGIMNEAMKGLTPEERKIAITSMGGQAAVAGGLRDADAELFAHRPDLFIKKLVPLVRERFGMDMTDEQIALMVSKNLNRSTGNFIGTQITMDSKLGKDTAIINKTKGIGAAYQSYLKSPEGAEEAASAAWKNFLAVFGSVYLPQITNGLLKLASALDSLGQWVGKNQGLVKGLVYAFTALAGGLIMRGTVLLLSAAFRGLGLALLMQSVGGAGGILTLVARLRSFGAELGLISAIPRLASVGTALSGVAGGLTAMTAITGLLTLGATLGGIALGLYGLWHAAQWLDKKVGAEVPENLKAKNLPKVAPGGRFQYIGPGEGMGKDNPSLAGNRGANFVAPGKSSAGGDLHSTINIDGRKVATAVTPYIAKNMGNSNTTGAIDNSLGLQMPGLK